MNGGWKRYAIGPSLMVWLLAFALTVEWRSQGAASVERNERRAALAEVVEARQRSTARLEERLADLRAQLDAAISASGERRLDELQSLGDRLAGLSGATTATGAGLIVELADASAASRGDPGDSDFRIQDVDIQSVVNALWAAGAEAIAVGGQRLVATSAVRNAGAAVLVNYRVLTSPYRIEAIGDPRALRERFEASEAARRFRAWVEIYGLGFSLAEGKDLSLPAFGGSLRFRYAQPIDDTG